MMRAGWPAWAAARLSDVNVTMPSGVHIEGSKGEGALRFLGTLEIQAPSAGFRDSLLGGVRMTSQADTIVGRRSRQLVR